MKLSDFDFDLPERLIAQHPADPRDSARLLHVPPGDAPFGDLGVQDLPSLLHPGDVLVVNDTRVIPARLTGKRSGPQGEAKIEVTLHKQLGPGENGAARWAVFARPARRLKPGDEVRFADDLAATVEARDGGEVTLCFHGDDAYLAAGLEKHGVMPLPPYIKRPAAGETADRDDYQTFFAARDGAVAAPTASLHFTPWLVEAIQARDVEIVTVTLHVGAGTFLPVKVEDLSEHVMHSEWGQVSAEAAERINACRGRVVAAGTTALRLIESAAAADGSLLAWTGDTDLFITPGYRFKRIEALLTNFHLPKSTLFMLVSAFAGQERMRAAYAHAVAKEYRFFSYGDASFLERAG
jgi:S-adenosylmethionine:tRNA ribosyltransferase-isomerase